MPELICAETTLMAKPGEQFTCAICKQTFTASGRTEEEKMAEFHQHMKGKVAGSCCDECWEKVVLPLLEKHPELRA